MTNLELQKTANEVRKGIVSGVHAAKAGHPGGSLSAAALVEKYKLDAKGVYEQVKEFLA